MRRGSTHYDPNYRVAIGTLICVKDALECRGEAPKPLLMPSKRTKQNYQCGKDTEEEPRNSVQGARNIYAHCLRY